MKKNVKPNFSIFEKYEKIFFMWSFSSSSGRNIQNIKNLKRFAENIILLPATSSSEIRSDTSGGFDLVLSSAKEKGRFVDLVKRILADVDIQKQKESDS